jgi:hypothetical protein
MERGSNPRSNIKAVQEGTRFRPLIHWGYFIYILFYGSIPSEGLVLSSPPRPERLWGPASLLSNGYRLSLSLGINRPGREAPSTAEVKNAWSYTSTPYTRLQVFPSGGAV